MEDNLDSYFQPEVLKKISRICEGFHEDDEINFFIGDYYWKQVSDFWKHNWVKSPNGLGIVPKKVNEFTYGNIHIIHDTENYYRFDIGD